VNEVNLQLHIGGLVSNWSPCCQSYDKHFSCDLTLAGDLQSPAFGKLRGANLPLFLVTTGE